MGGVFSHPDPELQIILLPENNDFGVGCKRKKKNKRHSCHSNINNVPRPQIPLPIYGYPGYPIISGYPLNNNFQFPTNPYIPYNPYMPYPAIPYQSSKQFQAPNFYEPKNQMDMAIKEEYKKPDSQPIVSSKKKTSKIGSKKSSKMIQRSKQLVKHLEKILNSNEPPEYGDQVAIGPFGINEPEQKAEIAKDQFQPEPLPVPQQLPPPPPPLPPTPIYDQPKLDPVKLPPEEDDKSQSKIMPTIKILMKNDDDGPIRNIGGFTSSLPINLNNLDQAKDKQINRANQPLTPPLDIKQIKSQEMIKQKEFKTMKIDRSAVKINSKEGKLKQADNLARNNMEKMEVVFKIQPPTMGDNRKVERNKFLIKKNQKKINDLNLELENNKKITSKSRTRSRKHKSKSTSRSRKHRTMNVIVGQTKQTMELNRNIEQKNEIGLIKLNKQTTKLSVANKNEIKMDQSIDNQGKTITDLEKGVQWKKMNNLVSENITTKKLQENSGSKKSRKSRKIYWKTLPIDNQNLDPNSNSIKNESPKLKDQKSGSTSSSSSSGSSSEEPKHDDNNNNNNEQTPLSKIQKIIGNLFSR